MIDIKAIRAAAEAVKGLPDGDWNYEKRSRTVWNGVLHMVCYIRGWTHLQYLPDGDDLPDAMGQHIANMNPATVIALLDKLEAAEKDAARLDWLLTYFVSDDTSKDDVLIAASEVGVDQIKLLIDAAMKEQK